MLAAKIPILSSLPPLLLSLSLSLSLDPSLPSLTGAFPLVRAAFGEGRGPIFLDNLDCNGDEPELIKCEHSGVGFHNCFHSEDVAVVCIGGWCVYIGGRYVLIGVCRWVVCVVVGGVCSGMYIKWIMCVLEYVRIYIYVGG